ncbi:hypothetical protein ABZY90_22380 [Streptomyces sp. NPDC006422]|uniref:hypothetical protein n=1 Tax=unclassified Streptomyces TaxID=2593676 RepID=UPI0033B1F361
MRESRLRRPAEPAGRRMPAPRPQWEGLFVAPDYGADDAGAELSEPPRHEPTAVARRRRGGRRGGGRRRDV